MSNILDQLYLIKIDEAGRKSEVPATEANFQVGGAGTANFGLSSNITSSAVPGNTDLSTSTSSVILGGQFNNLSGVWSTIGGGLFNTISGDGATLDGGYFNRIIYGGYQVIGGGLRNCISGGNANNIAGGRDNIITKSSCDTSILGGCCHFIEAAGGSVVLGGFSNRIVSGSVEAGGIGGIAGGWLNLIGTPRNSIIDNQSRASIILNGQRNHIWGANNCFSSIINGFCGYIVSGSHSTILNGRNNTISGSNGLILNGTENKVFSNYGSILAGRRSTIQTNHSGAVLLSDSQERDHFSSGPNTLTLDFISGTYIKNIIILEHSYAPSSSISFGVSGQIATDSNYFYSHDGIRWRRAALSEW